MNNLNEEKNGFRMYELNCLINLRHAEKIKEIAKNIETWVEKKKGELVEIEKKETEEAKGGKGQIWIEKKRFAYPVNKDNSGYYLNSRLLLKPADVKDLKRFLKLEKEIVRFFILTGENAPAPAPLRNAVALENMNQLEEVRPERKAPVEKKFPEPFRMERKIEVEKKPVIEVEKELLVDLETPALIEEIIPEVPKKEGPVEVKEPEAPKEVKKTEIEPATKPQKKKVEEKTKEESKPEPEAVKEEKSAKHKKITLEELDKRLDDILNEDIL
jgi:ribosomal protein S6